MRYILLLCLFASLSFTLRPLDAQPPDTTDNATTNTRVAVDPIRHLADDAPGNTAFCFGVHNGSKFVSMMMRSKLALQLTKVMAANSDNKDGEDAAADAATDAATDVDVGEIIWNLSENELDLSTIQISFDDDAKQTLLNLSNHQEDLLDVASQLLANDAILIGDESWSATWEAICKSIVIAREKTSLVRRDADTLALEGFDALMADESFANIRIPNTVLSCQLTDSASTKRLLQQISKSSQAATDDDLGGWKYRSEEIQSVSMAVFSYPLVDLVGSEVNETEELNAQELSERKQLHALLLGRSLQFAIGLVDSRLVIYTGENFPDAAPLIRHASDYSKRLADRNTLASVMPLQDETMIASAFVSDRFAKSSQVMGRQGWIANTIGLISTMPMAIQIDGVAIDQMAMAMGLPDIGWTQLIEKLDHIDKQWNQLAITKAGWSATIAASSSGIVGRSESRWIDPRLPSTPLTVDQHIGDDVIAFYARQGTTTAARCLIAYDFVSHLCLGFSRITIMIGDDQEFDQGVNLHFRRLGQMPLRLANIVNDKWLPALGNGGQAIVLTRFDPTPELADNVPFELTLVSQVANRQKLAEAGKMLKQWCNSTINQYCEIIKKMDSDTADIDVPIVEPTILFTDEQSDVFTLAFSTAATDEPSDDDEKASIQDAFDLNLDSLGSIYHWRLTDDVFTLGTNPLISKKMLSPRPDLAHRRELETTPNTQPSTLRSVIWIDTDQIAKMFDGIDDPAAKDAVNVIRSIDSFHRIGVTQADKTIHRWKLTMPLGEAVD